MTIRHRALTVAAALVALACAACGPVDDASEPAEDTAAEPAEDTAAEAQEVEQADAAPEAEDVPREHAAALKQAERYIEFSAFSEAGLFEQLTSEYGSGFPPEAAQYAIDNLEVDWNEQALKQARSYLETFPMSDHELREQLISEFGGQFTPEQADYALANL